MAEQTSNPFKPGAGRSPAHLAGRSSEQEVLQGMMAEILFPRVAAGDVMQEEAPQHLKIVGPRGVGKMALLNWMQREGKPKEILAVRWAYVQGKTTEETFESLLDELIGGPKSEPRTKIEEKIPFIKVVREWRRGQIRKTSFRQVLAERLKRNPVLLLLDEVMHYDKDLLAQVLQESQRLSSERWPLALILAGTPALDYRLRDVEASFVKRSRNLFINELSDEAVREALKDPFEQRDIKISDEALELMASLTSNYPFFTQVVGRVVWDSKKGRTEINASLVEEAKPAIQKECGYFYGGLYEDIRSDELLPYASQMVAIVDEAASSLPPEVVVARLAAANDGMEEKQANKIFQQLLDHGLIWLKDYREVKRGIPSFFTYFKAEHKRSQLLASEPSPAK